MLRAALGRLLAAPVVLAVVAATVVAVLGVPSPAHARSAQRTVISREVIGHSVRGRPIVAYHLGQRRADGRPTQTVVLMSEMHGDEQAPAVMLRRLIDGEPIGGVDLWVVPTYNPDGVAAHRRQNAHGVDLNRNYPYKWTHITGATNSGPRPASEPETRAMMGFLRRVRPDRILSFHQPFDSVGSDSRAPGFVRRVAQLLHLPVSHLDCGSSCHGTMTMWFDHTFPGVALTVELPAHPSRHYLRVEAPEALLRIFDADHGTPHAEPA